MSRNWEPGRQNSGYEKLLILQSKWPVPFDVYLLRYRKGAYVNWHKDPAPLGTKHFRLNVFLKEADMGGEFRIRQPDKAILDWKRVQLFRPDIQNHAVFRVLEGTRYVLSIGWLWRGYGKV